MGCNIAIGGVLGRRADFISNIFFVGDRSIFLSLRPCSILVPYVACCTHIMSSMHQLIQKMPAQQIKLLFPDNLTVQTWGIGILLKPSHSPHNRVGGLH